MPRLKPADVAAAVASGITQKLPDGNSLFLYVRGGSAIWIHQYREGASMRSRSLGSAADMSPAAARRAREDFAAERRRSRIERRGVVVRLTAEPAREPERAAATVKRMRFADVVESAIPRLEAENDWKSNSTQPREYRKLKTGALGKLWADEIDQNNIAAELNIRWGHALASADKHRMRIMQVIDHAVAKGWRPDGPNPARKEVIKHLVSKPPKSVPHASMPVADVPAFMADLSADTTNEGRALAFLLHTAARTAEARDMYWSEIEGNVWHIPSARMKEGISNGDHWVPLTPAALALLGKPKKSGLIFGELQEHALDDKLKELRPDMLVPVPGHPDAPPTVHGFRASFTGWADKANWSERLWDRAMHHSSKVGGSYRREPLTEQRAPMMVAWSDFLAGEARA